MEDNTLDELEDDMPDGKEGNDSRNALLGHNVLVSWKPEYDLGIPIVDEQHRAIVATINTLYYSMRNGHSESVLAPVIDMITDYTRIHFNIEEIFFRSCDFPEMKRHHSLHVELLETMSKVGHESMWNQDPFQFLRFLKHWWLEHICEEDRKFRAFLK